MTVTVFTNPSNPQCEATEQELTRLGITPGLLRILVEA